MPTIVSIDTLKGWFKNGFKPVEAQFAAWMDSYWHKSENIPVAKIEGLQTFLNSLPTSSAIDSLLTQLQLEVINLNTNGTYNLAAGKNIDFIRFESAVDQTLFIQDTESGEDLVGEIEIAANKPLILRLAIGALQSATRPLTITGVTAAVTLRIRKI